MRSVVAKPSSVDELRRALARAEARFRNIIECNADAQIVVDQAGVVRFANRAAAKLFGRDTSAIVGTLFGFPVMAGETTEVDIAHDGAQRVAEMRVDATEWEDAPAFIASLRDITERRQAEQMERHLLREQAARAAAEDGAQRLSFLLNTTTLLLSSLDSRDKPRLLAGLCVERLADWAVVYGLTDDGQLRRLAVTHRDPRKQHLADELCAIPIDLKGNHPIVQVMRSKQPRIARDLTPEQLAGMAPSPRELEIALELGVSSFMAVPIVARDRALGAIAFVLATAERAYDETDLSLAADVAGRAALAMDNAMLHEQAIQAHQRKADFVAVVSHDLRTPLNAIIGYADLLEMGVPEPLPESALEKVVRMRAAAQHQLYLLNELLAYARLEANREVPKIQHVDLREVVRDVVAVAEPLASKEGLELRVEMPPGELALDTDPDKLKQILLNLLGNAVKYTTEGEVTLLIARLDGGGVQFRVSDTGLGIAPEHLPKVFEPFWQANRSQRNTGAGAGLGLSVVKHLVELLGATVSVKSEPGNGSTFVVTFGA